MSQDSNKKLQGIVVIVGPTASGKTSLAVKVAELFNGEVISADSRQVYRNLDIGTGKVTKAEMHAVPHHLIDIADPRSVYTAADFLKDADKAIADIAARGKLPIVAGGTFFYIDALLGIRTLVGVVPNTMLRAHLETLSTEQLYEKLVEIDPKSAERIDKHNARRLVRAIEIVAVRGNMPTVVPEQRYEACIIGIDVPPDILRECINARLDATLARGLVEETKSLLAQGILESRLNEIGLEYRVVLAHLHGEYTYEEMRTVLKQKVWQYAKRQRTWLKKMENVRWVSLNETESSCDRKDFFRR